MALSRISDLTAGTVPMIGTSLFEVSVPNAGAPSGYDSRKFTLTNVLSNAVAKIGDTMTGGLLVNGTLTQGVANPNAGFQGIASISSAYNEIAVYGAGPGTSAKYCAISADNTYGYLYASTDLPLRIQGKGASGNIYLETGASPTTRMLFTASGIINAYTSFSVCKADGSTYFTLYDDGNSHIDSTTALWLNANGNPVTIGGPTTFSNKLTVQFPDSSNYQMFVAGTTKAVRIFTNSGTAYIEGVTTNNAAYSPITIGGSTLAFHTASVNRMAIDAAGVTTFNGYVKIAFPDAGGAQLLVSGTTYAMRIYTTSTFAELAAVTPTISGLVPLRLSGSTVEIATPQTTINSKVIIQSDANQLWLKSLNNTVNTNIVMECTGVHVYAVAAGTDGNWGVFDSTNNRWGLTLTSGGDLIIPRDITSGNTIYANNWLYAYGGVRCRNRANTTFVDFYDDGNSHIESSTYLWFNSTTGVPSVFGGALTTKLITSSINGQNATNTNPDVANIYLDDKGASSGSGGSITFSASDSQWRYASIRGFATNGSGKSTGNIYIQNRRSVDDTFLTVTAAFNDTGICYNAAASWSSLSDRSLKQDIEPYKRGLDAIVNLSPVQFRYQPGTLFTTEDAPSRVLYGLIADEVFPHIPEACGSIDFAIDDDIDGEKKTVATLNPTDLIYSLINAVKELHAEIQNIKSSLH